MSTLIKANVQDGILTIALDRPDKKNAVNREMLEAIADRLRGAEIDDNVRVAVITGSETVFAAGADLAEFQKYTIETIHRDPRLECWRAIWAFSKPLIAAVEGYCLGAGSELMLACDIIIAGASAKFGQPEINLGFMPGAGGSQVLPRRVGSSVAAHMVLTGKPISAPHAYKLGLVLDVTDDGACLARAMEIAGEIAQKAPLAIKAAVQALRTARETPLQSGMMMERRLYESVFATEDRLEGMTAFLEKRQPIFQGR